MTEPGRWDLSSLPVLAEPRWQLLPMNLKMGWTWLDHMMSRVIILESSPSNLLPEAMDKYIFVLDLILTHSYFG